METKIREMLSKGEIIEPKDFEIPRAMQDQLMALEELGEEVERLGSKIQTTLRHETKEETNKVICKGGTSSVPLVNEIISRTETIKLITNKIKMLWEMCEL